MAELCPRTSREPWPREHGGSGEVKTPYRRWSWKRTEDQSWLWTCSVHGRKPAEALEEDPSREVSPGQKGGSHNEIRTPSKTVIEEENRKLSDGCINNLFTTPGVSSCARLASFHLLIFPWSCRQPNEEDSMLQGHLLQA